MIYYNNVMIMNYRIFIIINKGENCTKSDRGTKMSWHLNVGLKTPYAYCREKMYIHESVYMHNVDMCRTGHEVMKAHKCMHTHTHTTQTHTLRAFTMDRLIHVYLNG